MYKISLLYDDGRVEDNQKESWSTINKATEIALKSLGDNPDIVGFKINKTDSKEEHPTLTKTRRNPVCIY